MYCLPHPVWRTFLSAGVSKRPSCGQECPRCGWLLLLVCVALPCVVFAQPKLTSASPQWIQRGTTLDFTLSGEKLHSVTGLVFSGESGLTASFIPRFTQSSAEIAVESDSGAFTVAPAVDKNTGTSLVVRLNAATNAAIGARELRVMAPTGVSAPVAINVGALPEIAEKEPNNTLEQAQAVTLPATLSGVISSATEVDSFRFKANKGDVIVFDVEASRRGSALDSSVAMLDSKGAELARSEDVNGFDSLLAFTAPASGEFVLQMRDFQYRGAGNYDYRIHAGALPYVSDVFPFGFQRGRPADLQIVGHNLGSASKMTLSVAADAPLGRQEIRLKLPQGVSNPLTFDVQDLSEVMEVATNATNTVSAPGIVNGRIEATDDIDYFKFTAVSDQRLTIDVSARRFGSPLDPLLLVYSGGGMITQNDDAADADARVDIDVKKGGEYILAIRDLTSRGGEHFGYRISIRPPQPSFAAKFFPDTVRLHRGGLAKVRCEVTRSGFDGPIEISAPGLPPGIIAEPLIIPAGAASGTFLLQASAATPIGNMPLALNASARINSKPASAAVAPVQVDDKSEKPAKEAFLTVLEQAPFTADPVTLSAALDQGEATNVTFSIRRENDFNGEVKVALEGFSAGRDPITKSFDLQPVTLKAGDTSATFNLRAKADAEVGTRHVFARAEANVGGETIVQYSRPVPVTVAQIPFVMAVVTPRAFLTLPRPGATSAVEEITVKFKADRRGYNGEIPLTLEGVPEGVTIADAKVPAGSGEAAVRLVPTKAKPGTNYSFKALGIATHNDRIYRHKSGSVKLFIETPPVEFASTNAPSTASK